MDPCKRETVLFLRRFLEDIALDSPPEIRWLKRAYPPVGEGEALGVFPASFNPPTKAHLWILEEGRRKGLKELAVVLDKRPLDKEVREAELVDRLLMLLKLQILEQHPHVFVINFNLAHQLRVFVAIRARS